jgi:DNA-binding NtrC family response regulator
VPLRILCISANGPILQTRKLLLERNGYEVVPALNFREVEEACHASHFDLALIGQDIEAKIKKALGFKIKELCAGTPILEMCRYSPEIEGSAFTVTDSPDELLAVVSSILSGKAVEGTRDQGSGQGR